MYLYECHLGGIYASDEIIAEEELYCEVCGDSDRYIGAIDEDDPLEVVYNLINDACGVKLCEPNCDGKNCDKCPYFDYSGGYNKAEIVALLTGWYPEDEVEKFFENLAKEKLSYKA